MTTPATSVAGSLGASGVLATGNTFEFIDFLVPKGVRRVTFFVRFSTAAGPCTFRVQRNGTGGFQRAIPALVIAAPTTAEETTVVLDFPQREGRLRPLIDNNSGANVNVSVEVAYDLPEGG